MGFYNILNAGHEEHLYHMANMSEANWLMGVNCKFYPCKSYDRDINSDPHPEYDDPVEINVVFDDNPKATLEKRNWLAEGEDLPYLIYVSSIVYPKYKEFKSKCKEQGTDIRKVFSDSFDSSGEVIDELSVKEFMIKVSKFAMIELPYTMEDEGVQKFTVTDVQGDSINPFIWLCKLAPYHEQVDLNPSTPDIDNRTDYTENSSVVGNSFLTGKL